jgi:hypothetical protein
MTADEWDQTDRLYLMWPVLTASNKRAAVHSRSRKYRLAACGFCRMVWDSLTDKRSRKAVEVAESFADGQATPDQLEGARAQAMDAYTEVSSRCSLSAGAPEYQREMNRALACYAAAYVTHKSPGKAVEKATSVLGLLDHRIEVPTLCQPCDLLREVFGNPFRPVAVDRSWLTANVLDLARTIYMERCFDRTLILRDALLDAGCTDETILGHCQQQEHCRGCWLIDLLLGKS